jgi:hypothetical protein
MQSKVTLLWKAFQKYKNPHTCPNICTLPIIMQWHSLLRHYATRWKVVGSISDEAIGFFN